MSIVEKSGNNLVVRIPSAIAERAEVREGCRAEFHEIDGTLVIKLRPPTKYSLAEMLKGCTPSRLHAEFDFGPDLGKEIVDYFAKGA